MKILVLPDIHGRKFWEEPCKRVEDYDKIIFLGDYMDPYDFEHITVPEALENFENILTFADAHKDKVTLLLGNHDMPYFSKKYKSFSWWHCRHSKKYCNDISQRFEEYKELFRIAEVADDVLFTHAGCTPGWIMTVFTEQYKVTSPDDLAFSLNNLLNTDKGLKYLYMISEDRGGRDRYASCIWADASDTMWYQDRLKDPELSVSETVFQIMKIKQVFGHTLQAFYNEDRSIGYGDVIEVMNNKMLDNCHAYVLDTKEFTIEKL